MTVHTIPEIFQAWIQVGGQPGDYAVYMTAIALAESGGNDHAVSASGDYGVWQINYVHEPEFPILWNRKFTLLGSARMAKSISANGTNIGPWCTIWEDPGHGNCGSYHAPPPDAQSPAGQKVAHVAAVMGAVTPPLGNPVRLSGPPDTPGDAGWSHLQNLLGYESSGWRDQMTTDRQRMRGR